MESTLDLLKCEYFLLDEYIVLSTGPATGILYLTVNSPHFISGHIRLKGNSGGRYPSKYLEMIDYIFGPENNTIEVCSRYVRGRAFTVDINPATKPDLVDDAQELSK